MSLSVVGLRIESGVGADGTLTHQQTILAGDVVIAGVHFDSPGRTIIIAGGAGSVFADLYSGPAANNNSDVIADKIANASEPASYAFTGGGPGQPWTGFVLVLRPQGTASRDAALATQSNTPNTQPYASPSINVAANSLAISLVTGNSANNIFDDTVDNGYTFLDADGTFPVGLAVRPFTNAAATGQTEFGRTALSASQGYSFSYVDTGAVGDTTPPAETNQQQAVAQATEVVVADTVTADEASTVHMAVYATGSTAPADGAAVEAATIGAAGCLATASGVIATDGGNVALTSTGFAPQNVDVYTTAVDAAGNYSTPVGQTGLYAGQVGLTLTPPGAVAGLTPEERFYIEVTGELPQ